MWRRFCVLEQAMRTGRRTSWRSPRTVLALLRSMEMQERRLGRCVMCGEAQSVVIRDGQARTVCACAEEQPLLRMAA